MPPKYRVPILLFTVAASFHFIHYVPKYMYKKRNQDNTTEQQNDEK